MKAPIPQICLGIVIIVIAFFTSISASWAVPLTTTETVKPLTSSPTSPQKLTGKRPQGIEGIWQISDGIIPEGKNEKRTIEIKSNRQVYILNSKSVQGNYKGLGFLENNHLFVAFGPDTGNLELAVYHINDNGTLEGKWAIAGDSTIGKDHVTGGTPGTLEGRYQIKGEYPVGFPYYQGILTIIPQGEVYELSLRIASDYTKGIGTRSGDNLIVAWGENKLFKVIDYTIEEQTLKGFSVEINQSKLKPEMLTRI